MPNWTENELTIYGPIKQIKRFKKIAQYKGETNEQLHGDFRLSQIIPIPNPDNCTCDQLIQLFGCKWDCDGDLINEEYDAREVQGELIYEFDSPWNPPIEWLKKASAKFMKLFFSLHYKETGMGFQGTADGEKGIIIDHEEEFEPDSPED